MFEFKARIPLEKDLVIKIKDYDLIGSDDSTNLFKYPINLYLNSTFQIDLFFIQ